MRGDAEHLTLAAPDCYERLGTFAQLNPPVRDASHRDGIWRGVAQGVIDSIGSDHSPHTREEKAHAYPKTHSGMTGTQTLVPVMLDHVNAGRLSLARFVDLTSAGPARVFGIARKGRIAVGYDADLTVVDLKRRETITDRWIASRAGWTPYNGMSVTGWPVGTFVRGRKVMWQGELAAPSTGEAFASSRRCNRLTVAACEARRRSTGGTVRPRTRRCGCAPPGRRRTSPAASSP